MHLNKNQLGVSAVENMNSGIIDLSPLYMMVKNDFRRNAIHGNSREGRIYGKKVKELGNKIDDKKGFYLWGKYDNNGSWQAIYLGKAGSGKTTSLRARIVEELKDERAFIWCSVMPSKEYVRSHWYQFYPRTKPAENHIKRSLRKEGSTFIVWVSMSYLEEYKIMDIEAHLIKKLNPCANLNRPLPRLELEEIAMEIIRRMKSEINKNNSTPCCLCLPNDQQC